LKKEYLITVDLGGTKILSALFDKENKIIERVKIPTDAKKGAKHLVKDIASSVKQLIKQAGVKSGNVIAVSMGVPGTVNPESGMIETAPNLDIKKFNIKQSLEDLIEIPVLIENDVNLAGLGIKKYEYKNNVKNMLVVFVGTGIGGALFFNGKLYRGSSFYAGEIGHIKVDKNGAFSSEPDSSFEELASRTAIVNSIVQHIKKGKKSVLENFVKEDKKIKSKSIAKAISKDDDLVKKEISKGCKIIGTVLGSLTTLLNFDSIVLGGGLLEANHEFMLPKIQDAFNKSVVKEIGRVVKLNVTKLGDDAPLYGGIALSEEFSGNG